MVKIEQNVLFIERMASLLLLKIGIQTLHVIDVSINRHTYQWAFMDDVVSREMAFEKK